MSKQVIHIYGAPGSGTTTFGKYICEKLGYHLMDTDDYFWQPTDPPFTLKRDIHERIELMKQDIAKYDNVVISGSLAVWGDVLIPYFTLAIRIYTDTNLRIQRIKKRERERFGSRIDIGGDMYDDHCKFLEWASSYDTGGLNMRSKAEHDSWQKQLQCKRVDLDGSKALEYNFEALKPYLRSC